MPGLERDHAQGNASRDFSFVGKQREGIKAVFRQRFKNNINTTVKAGNQKRGDHVHCQI